MNDSEVDKTMETLKRAQIEKRENEMEFLAEITVALKHFYKNRNISFGREFVDGDKAVVNIDGFTYMIEVSRLDK